MTVYVRFALQNKHFCPFLPSLLAHDGVGGLEAVLEALDERLALLVLHGAAPDLLRLHGGHAVPVLVRLVVNCDMNDISNGENFTQRNMEPCTASPWWSLWSWLHATTSD